MTEAERDRMTILGNAVDAMLTGGNHLASVLVGRLGGGFQHRFPPTRPGHEVLVEMGCGDTYEIWCCWAAIMRARNTLE